MASVRRENGDSSASLNAQHASASSESPDASKVSTRSFTLRRSEAAPGIDGVFAVLEGPQARVDHLCDALRKVFTAGGVHPSASGTDREDFVIHALLPLHLDDVSTALAVWIDTDIVCATVHGGHAYLSTPASWINLGVVAGPKDTQERVIATRLTPSTGDCLLLVSDGIAKHVWQHDLQQTSRGISAQFTEQDAADWLIHLAAERGAPNTAALVVQFALANGGRRPAAIDAQPKAIPSTTVPAIPAERTEAAVPSKLPIGQEASQISGPRQALPAEAATGLSLGQPAKLPPVASTEPRVSHKVPPQAPVMSAAAASGLAAEVVARKTREPKMDTVQQAAPTSSQPVHSKQVPTPPEPAATHMPADRKTLALSAAGIVALAAACFGLFFLLHDRGHQTAHPPVPQRRTAPTAVPAPQLQRPIALRAVQASATRLNLSWHAVPGATGYVVRLNRHQYRVGATHLAVVESFVPGTWATWSVRAYNKTRRDLRSATMLTYIKPVPATSWSFAPVSAPNGNGMLLAYNPGPQTSNIRLQVSPGTFVTASTAQVPPGSTVEIGMRAPRRNTVAQGFGATVLATSPVLPQRMLVTGHTARTAYGRPTPNGADALAAPAS